MGAEVFYNHSKGKTANLAFRTVVDAAAFDHGHSGYTGTIAEKSEFTVIRDTPDDVLVLVKRVNARDAELLGERLLAAKAPETTPLKRAKIIAEVLIAIDDPRVHDKWGPAGCIEVGDGEYLFFGWASS